MYKVVLPTAFNCVTIYFSTNLYVEDCWDYVLVFDGVKAEGHKIKRMKHEEVIAAIDKAIGQRNV
jgi:hypothetical protein